MDADEQARCGNLAKHRVERRARGREPRNAPSGPGAARCLHALHDEATIGIALLGGVEPAFAADGAKLLSPAVEEQIVGIAADLELIDPLA